MFDGTCNCVNMCAYLHPVFLSRLLGVNMSVAHIPIPSGNCSLKSKVKVFPALEAKSSSTSIASDRFWERQCAKHLLHH